MKRSYLQRLTRTSSGVSSQISTERNSSKFILSIVEKGQKKAQDKSYGSELVGVGTSNECFGSESGLDPDSVRSETIEFKSL